MSDNKLILIPLDPTANLPSADQLHQVLSQVGLIGEPFKVVDDPSFRPGPRFRELVLFEHTHNVVELRPGPDGITEHRSGDSPAYCSISISSGSSEIEFLGAGNTEDPICANCGTQVEEWTEVVGAWYEAKDSCRWECLNCGSVLWPWELNWRRTAGFGRCEIAIWGVHAGEARPSPEIMKLIESSTGIAWDYFYYRM